MRFLDKMAQDPAKRIDVLGHILSLFDLEKAILAAEAKGKSREEQRADLRKEAKQCYDEHIASVRGTPEADYLTSVMAYYRVSLPEEELQRRYAMPLDDFIEKYWQNPITTRTANLLRNVHFVDPNFRTLGSVVAKPREWYERFTFAREGRHAFGKKALGELETALHKEGLYLGQKAE